MYHHCRGLSQSANASCHLMARNKPADPAGDRPRSGGLLEASLFSNMARRLRTPPDILADIPTLHYSERAVQIDAKSCSKAPFCLILPTLQVLRYARGMRQWQEKQSRGKTLAKEESSSTRHGVNNAISKSLTLPESGRG